MEELRSQMWQWGNPEISVRAGSHWTLRLKGKREKAVLPENRTKKNTTAVKNIPPDSLMYNRLSSVDPSQMLAKTGARAMQPTGIWQSRDRARNGHVSLALNKEYYIIFIFCFVLNIFYCLCYYSCPISPQLYFPLPCIPPSTHIPPQTPFSPCPWVIHVSSLASPFPILFLTSPCLFDAYQLCFLFPVPFPPIPPPSPHW